MTSQALRRHRRALLGPACTQILAATVVAMMVMTAGSVDRAPFPAAERGSQSVRELTDMTTVFIGGSVYLSILVIGVTMNLALGDQLRDLALLRAIGATPGQVRRSVVGQAAALAVPASAAGFLLAVPVGALWLAALRAHDVVPAAVHFVPSLRALPIALGVGLATSVAGAYLAAVRTSRMRPAAALIETATGRRHVRPVRTVLGLGLVAGGVVLSAVLAGLAPDQAGDAAFFVMLAECVGVGMLGPAVLRGVVRVLRPLARSGLPRVALDDLTTMTRALSGALVPLVLAAAFAGVKVAAHTTAAAVTGVADPAVDRWTDYSGTAVYCAFAAVAALTCFLTVLVGRRDDLAAIQLAGATRQQVVRMALLQALVVTATALVLAAAVAGATLVPVRHTALGTWVPSVPPTVVVAGVVLVGAVVAGGMVAPAALLTRRTPVEVVRMAA